VTNVLIYLGIGLVYSLVMGTYSIRKHKIDKSLWLTTYLPPIFLWPFFLLLNVINFIILVIMIVLILVDKTLFGK